MPEANAQHARAIARFVRVSPQKARLVVDLIRGLRAEEALHRLRFTRKRIAREVAKLLQSAIANATEKGDLDVDSLFVLRAFVNEGPRMKRIRPAPMGRAYHYQRRSAHIEVHVGERANANLVRRVEEPAAAPAAAPAKPARKPARKPAPARPAAKKKAPAAKKSAPAKSAAKAHKPAARKSTTTRAPKKGGE